MISKLQELISGPCAQKVLYFEEMLTPSVIRLVYWLSLVAVIWIGLRKMFSGGLGGFVEGIVFTVISVILARVIAELIILFFKIQEDIEAVAENTKVKVPAKRKVTTNATKKVSKKTT